MQSNFHVIEGLHKVFLNNSQCDARCCKQMQCKRLNKTFSFIRIVLILTLSVASGIIYAIVIGHISSQNVQIELLQRRMELLELIITKDQRHFHANDNAVNELESISYMVRNIRRLYRLNEILSSEIKGIYLSMETLSF